MSLVTSVTHHSHDKSKNHAHPAHATRPAPHCHDSARITMLYTIAVILIILWILGIVGVYTIGWFVHVLLVVAVILILVRIIQGRNPLR
jgi:fatty acid desaturase